MIAYETRLGKVEISEDYLEKLIGHEVTSCFGVVGMVPRRVKQKLYNRFTKSSMADTGIIVSGSGDNLSVEIHIVVTYGININAIAVSITEKVKHVVMEYTGLDIQKVTVKIDGIQE
ncbi:MAG: Asp23/Gls24 family envelope stress response protein [Clostridia bacterium]|nr:Asp23/Gls24 family envelope stress response protein [Clostridia bacterium]